MSLTNSVVLYTFISLQILSSIAESATFNSVGNSRSGSSGEIAGGEDPVAPPTAPSATSGGSISNRGRSRSMSLPAVGVRGVALGRSRAASASQSGS